MSYYSYFSFFAAMVYFYLGLYAYGLDRRSALNRSFMAMSAALMVKSFFAVCIYNAADEKACLYWHTLADFGWNLFPAATLSFFAVLTKTDFLLSKRFVALVFAPWVIFSVKSYSGALDGLVAFRRDHLGGFYAANLTSPNAIDLYFVVYSVICIYLLAAWMRRETSKRVRSQARVLMFFTVLTLAAGVATDIALPVAGFTSLPLMAHITVLIWFFGVRYSVSRYKLMTLTPALLSDEIISKIMDFVILTGPDGSVTFVNDRVCDLSGRSREELLGRPSGELVDAGRREGEAFDAALKTVSGEEIPVKITVSAIRDEWEDLKGFMICGRDDRPTRMLEREISLQKASERELLLSRQRYQMLADSLPQTVFEADLEGRLTYVNRSAYDFFKYDAKDFEAGLYVFQMVHPDDLESARAAIVELVTRKRPSVSGGREYRMMRKDGTTFDAVIHSYLITRDNNPVALCGIIIDITELKRARERLEKINEELEFKVRERTAALALTNEKLKNEIATREKIDAEALKATKIDSLGILAGGIAHDFNNFLMGVVGNLTLLKKRVEADEKAVEIIKRAEDVLFNAKKLTRQLLTFARENKPLTSPAIIGDMLKNAADFTLRGSGIECRFDFDRDLSCVEIDEGQMNQVFTNLIINAMQAMSGEGGTIEIGARNHSVADHPRTPLANGEYVKVWIKDDGVGISEEELPRIFDPYFTTKAVGSGLGLTSAFAIVRKHGGLITVESKKGEGTVFYIYLPVSMKRLAPAETDEMGPFEALSGRALLMDDELFIREAISDVLRSFGLEVDVCRDGAGAVEKHREALSEGRKYDVLVLDLTITGGMGGIDALEKIREAEPDAAAIATSGYYSGSVRDDYNRIGFRAFLAKPYKIEDLYKLVKKTLDEKRG